MFADLIWPPSEAKRADTLKDSPQLQLWTAGALTELGEFLEVGRELPVARVQLGVEAADRLNM